MGARLIPVFFLWLEKKTSWKVFEYLPAIIWIFLTPILLSNLNVIPKSSPVYTTFRSFAVPMRKKNWTFGVRNGRTEDVCLRAQDAV